MDRRLRDTRERLVAAALRGIAQCGWAAVTLSGVARECGISAPATYKHFPDKDALMQAALERIAADLTFQAREVRCDDPRESLLRIGERIVEFAQQHPHWHDFLLSPWAVRRLREGEGRFAYAFLEPAREEVDRALPRASPADRSRALLALWSSVHGHAAFVAAGVMQPDQEYLARILHAFLPAEQPSPQMSKQKDRP